MPSGALPHPPLAAQEAPSPAEREKGGAPGGADAVVREASALLRRGRRPALDQRVVVDRLALRLLVVELALRGEVAVLGGFGEPVFGRFLLAELGSAGALRARALEAREHVV